MGTKATQVKVAKQFLSKKTTTFYNKKKVGKVYTRQENTSYKLSQLLNKREKSRTIDFLRRPQYHLPLEVNVKSIETF